MKRFIVKTLLLGVLAVNFAVPAIAEENTVDYVDEMIKDLGENDGEIPLVIMPAPTDLEEEPVADAAEKNNGYKAENKPDSEDKNKSDSKEYKLIIEGKPTEGKIYKGLVPVRAVAEALGYRVSWNNADKSVTLENGETGSTIYIGENLYCTYSVNAVGMSEPTELECAPKIIASTAYVPAGFFELLYCQVNMEGNNIYINYSVQ